jgi:hypothetical protein
MGPPKPPKKEEKKEKKKERFKSWKEVLKDTKPIEGYFKFHLKRDHTLYLELRPDQLDKDFGLVMHYSRGIGDFNVIDGLPLSDSRLMRFRRVGDKIYLVHMNPRFTAEEDSPMRISLEDNVGHSIIADFKIESEHKETKSVLINMTKFLLSDYPDIARWLKFYYGKKPVTLDKNRSYVEKVMGFPKNVEIDVMLTFKASDFPVIGGAGISDYRSIPVGVRYSLFALPEKPMRPRIADDRVGHFLVAIKDFSRDQEETPYVRYVKRWRLEKKDPSAEISEPIKPIVFYIDKSVPREYRRYVKEGIEAWNKAFEKAGFRNAIIAKEAPEDDPNWNAEDIRYSTVRWSAAHRMGYAIGPSQADPRTGEILNADILISSEFVRSWMFDYQEMAAPDELIEKFMKARELQKELPPEISQYFCLAQIGKSHQLAIQYIFLAGLGVIDGGKPMPKEFLGDAIRDLVMHEVGHTLGLRHNFKASSGIPYERLHDTTFTRRHGVSLSVMDYGPVNIAVDPVKQGHYWNKEVGTYDIWAIQYAYAPVYKQTPDEPFKYSGELVKTPEEELVGLRKIARLATDPLHTYGTDEDNWLGPYAVDPLTNAWDLSSDPLQYARDRNAIVERVQPKLEERLIDEGEGYQRLRGAVSRLIFERFISLYPVTKMVGGLYFVRDHKGDPNGRPPFTPVPAEKQREAVKLLIDYAFDEDAFNFDPELLNKLAPNRWAHWGVGWFTIPVDFPIHSYVLMVQSTLLGELLHPVRLGRMIDNEIRTPKDKIYTMGELFETLTSAIWSEIMERGPRSINSFRRNLQRAYIRQLVDLLLGKFVPEDAKSIARFELQNLSNRMGQILKSDAKLDIYTRAHLAESKARIDRALEASLSIMVK